MNLTFCLALSKSIGLFSLICLSYCANLVTIGDLFKLSYRRKLKVITNPPTDTQTLPSNTQVILSLGWHGKIMDVLMEGFTAHPTSEANEMET